MEIPQELSGLIVHHYDSYIADDSLSDIDLLLICIYVLEKNKNATGVSLKECQAFFLSLGRKESNLSLATHRAKNNQLIHIQDNLLYFLSAGLKRLMARLGQVGKSPVYVIKSGHNFTAIKTFEEFLTNQFTGNELLLCDPHVSYETLLPLSSSKRCKRN